MSNVQENPSGPWNASSLAGPLPNFYASKLTASASAAVGNAYSCAPAANMVLTLPDATAPANVGGVIAVATTNANSDTVTLSPAVAGQLVNGASSLVLANTANDSVILFSDGTNWVVLASSLS